MKYLLSMLGMLVLSTAALASQCTSTELWGIETVISRNSEETLIPKGYRDYTLKIPKGEIACENYNFVGERVIVCDYDIAPFANFARNSDGSINNTLVNVHRNGNIQEPGYSYTIYYCES